MTRSRQTADWGSRAGLAKIVPSSVAVGSGTGSADSLGNVTFSGASSVSLNGCFSAAYDNYKIFTTIDTLVVGAVVNLRMRASGTDASGATDYKWSIQYFQGTGTPTNDGGSTGASSAGIMNLSSGGIATASIDVMNPSLAKFTNGFRLGAYGTGTHHFGSFLHSVSTAYDGFTLFCSSNIAGTIRVYGYTQ